MKVYVLDFLFFEVSAKSGNMCDEVTQEALEYIKTITTENEIEKVTNSQNTSQRNDTCDIL